MPRQPCRYGCGLPKKTGVHSCIWHWLGEQSPYVQEEYAVFRLSQAPTPHRPRVPAADWPAGTRWCAGCQTFVPLHYTTGSRCNACDSLAKYLSHVTRTYAITAAEYLALLAWQRGRCYICGRRAISRRLAVDHDHASGEVRGLLCSDNERGCNKAILGNLEAAAGKAPPMELARRLVQYLEVSPLDQLRAGVASPDLQHRVPAPDIGDPTF